MTFIGGFNPSTAAFYLSDVIHHHVAIGVHFIISGHIYRTQYQLGFNLSDLLFAHETQVVTSWHFQLAINLAFLGSGSIIAGHLLTAVPSYAYLRYDWSRF